MAENLEDHFYIFKMQKLRWPNFGVLFGLLAITLLSLNENLRFGVGMGDISYLALAGGTFILLGVLLIVLRKSHPVHLWILLVASSLVLLYLIYACTIGRGEESSWDGTIFF